MSSGIIESQLENLIARRLSHVIPPVSNSDMESLHEHSVRQNVTPPDGCRDVMTITSTPLREHSRFNQSVDNSFTGKDVRDSKEENTERKGGSESSFVEAVPDVAHYRLIGSNRKRELPPKKMSSSLSSLNSGSDTSVRSADGNSSKSLECIVAKPRPSMSLHKRNVNDSKSSVNQSLNESSKESFSVDDSSADANFYDKVKTILEDSANSSMNLESSLSSEYNRSSTRDLNVSVDDRSKDEEVELSTSGVKFMSKIKKVMTP